LNPGARATLALAGVTAFFLVAGPAFAERIRDGARGRHRAWSADDLSRHPDARRAAELITRARELARRETTWDFMVAEVVGGDLRRLAASRLPNLAPVIPLVGVNAVEPELPVLAARLMARFGYADVPVPAPTGPDAWPGWDRRARARALLTVVDDLPPDVGRVILAGTLELLEVQRARAEAERAAAEALGVG
jgi:hypothetical protein